MASHKHKNLFVFVVFVFFSFIAYFPAIHGYYLLGDDLNLWTMNANKDCNSFYAYQYLSDMGRPFFNLLTCAYGNFIDSIFDARYVRGLSICFTALFGYIVYQCLCYTPINRLHSFLLSIAILTLPPYQISVNGIVYQAYIISGLLSVGAFYIALNKWKPSNVWWKSLPNGYVGLSILMLVSALMTHQIRAMFYWTIFGGILFMLNTESWPKWRGKIYYLFTINLIAIGIYFVYAKLNFLFNAKVITQTTQHAIILSSNIIEKLEWFMSVSLIASLNLWQLSPNAYTAWWGATIILAGLVVVLIRHFTISTKQPWHSKAILFNLERTGMLIGLLVLSYLPALAAANTNTAAFRTYSTLMPFIVFALYWGAHNCLLVVPDKVRKGVLTSLLAVAAIFGALNSQYNSIYFFNLGLSIELRQILSGLHSADLKNYDRIHIFMNDRSKVLSLSAPWSVDSPPAQGGEFGYYHGWNEHNVRMMTLAVQPELPENKRNEFKKLYSPPRKVSAGFKSDYEPFQDRVLLIDLTKLVHFY